MCVSYPCDTGQLSSARLYRGWHVDIGAVKLIIKKLQCFLYQLYPFFSYHLKYERVSLPNINALGGLIFHKNQEKTTWHFYMPYGQNS